MQKKSKSPKGSKPLAILKNKPQIETLIAEIQKLNSKQLKEKYWILLCENTEFAVEFDPALAKILTYDQIRKRLAFALWENNLNGAVCYCKKTESYTRQQIQAICKFKDERAVYKIVRSLSKKV